MYNTCNSLRAGAPAVFTRTKFGLTQHQLARTLGISRSAVAMMETGKRGVPASAQAAFNEMAGIAPGLPEPAIVTRRGRKPGIVFAAAAPAIVTSTNPQCQPSKHSQEKPGNSVDAQPRDKLTTVEKIKRINGTEKAVLKLNKHKDSHAWQLRQLRRQRNYALEQHTFLTEQVTALRLVVACHQKLLKTVSVKKLSDQFSLSIAYNQYKLVKLEQRLEKYDAINILAIERKMAAQEIWINVADQCIADLTQQSEIPAVRVDDPASRPVMVEHTFCHRDMQAARHLG